MKFLNWYSGLLYYLCIIAPDEPLFHTAVESQHHEKFLVRGPPPVLKSGDKSVEGEVPVFIVIILVQFDFVQKNNNDDDGNHSTPGVDSTHSVHLNNRDCHVKDNQTKCINHCPQKMFLNNSFKIVLYCNSDFFTFEIYHGCFNFIRSITWLLFFFHAKFNSTVCCPYY